MKKRKYCYLRIKDGGLDVTVKLACHANLDEEEKQRIINDILRALGRLPKEENEEQK